MEFPEDLGFCGVDSTSGTGAPDSSTAVFGWFLFSPFTHFASHYLGLGTASSGTGVQMDSGDFCSLNRPSKTWASCCMSNTQTAEPGMLAETNNGNKDVIRKKYRHSVGFSASFERPSTCLGVLKTDPGWRLVPACGWCHSWRAGGWSKSGSLLGWSSWAGPLETLSTVSPGRVESRPGQTYRHEPHGTPSPAMRKSNMIKRLKDCRWKISK